MGSREIRGRCDTTELPSKCWARATRTGAFYRTPIGSQENAVILDMQGCRYFSIHVPNGDRGALDGHGSDEVAECSRLQALR
mmetsp:Transcript_17115/g.24044  ORF Transcript_17115/g.24044 Transcript_17115/m.24044 type:complete len:82 (+) Transcript_17115:91-336(+)